VTMTGIRRLERIQAPSGMTNPFVFFAIFATFVV
jgi:hypothetical protein